MQLKIYNMDTDLEIEYILIKTALDKMLYTIKLKYTDPPENPVIPESKLKAMKVLSDAINMLNLLYGLLKENNKQFQEAKIKYLKDMSMRCIIKLFICIVNL